MPTPASIVSDALARVLGYTPDEYDDTTRLADLDIDSLALTQLSVELSRLAGDVIEPGELTDQTSVADLISITSRHPAGPDRWVDLLRAGADEHRGIHFVGESVHLSWATLLEDATHYAAVLAADHGIKAGSKVALLGATSSTLVTAIEAVWLLGACAIVLPVPMRVADADAFVTETGRRAERADADLVLLDDLAAAIAEPTAFSMPTRPIAELVTATATPVPLNGCDTPDGLVVLQFTSGSTSDPKGVQVTERVLTTNLAGIDSRLGIDPERDVAVSWLPLYHDMGLIGLLASCMRTGTELVLASPQDFMAFPRRWMRWISDHAGTITSGPNFAYELAAGTLEATAANRFDLSNLRIAISGAEPVQPATVHRFLTAGARHGLSPNAFFPAYGLAEVGIAGTFPEVGAGLRTERVDDHRLRTDGHAAPVGDDGREMVLLGHPVDGVQLRISDPDTGAPLPVRRVGEIQLTGPSVTPGYYQRPGHGLTGAWLRTGDLGYLTESGELVVCGRSTDMMVVAGRNVYPQDIEIVASAVDGVRAGNVVAFGIPDVAGTEAVVVVAETRSTDPAIRNRMARQVRRAITHRCDVTPRHVVIADAGHLSKTSSGKVRRQTERARYLELEQHTPAATP